MYPVAYWIAFHGGRFKSVLLFLLLLPFFVSFVIRIIAWQFILADDGIILGALKDIGLIPTAPTCSRPRSRSSPGSPTTRCRSCCCRSTSRCSGSTAPTSRPPPTSTRASSTRFRSVILPLSAPGIYAGIVLVAITNIGDYVSAAILGGPVDDDDRQRHPDPVRQQRQLPDRLGAGADPDGRRCWSRWRSTRGSSGRGRCRSTSRERRRRAAAPQRRRARKPQGPALAAGAPARLRARGRCW